MDRVFEWVMLSRPELDAHRFMEAIDAAIDAGGTRGGGGGGGGGPGGGGGGPSGCEGRAARPPRAAA
jgi:hypothetical protein